MNTVIGVIGNGFVGQATQQFSKAANTDLLVYDIEPTKCIPAGLTLVQLCRRAHLIFVCVPTPMDEERGACDTSIVESVVRRCQSLIAENADLRKITSEEGAEVQGYVVCTPRQQSHRRPTFPPAIIVRSTVPPGTCERLGVLHMPEYLTERCWLQDFRATRVWELGIPAIIAPNLYQAYSFRMQRLLTSCRQANVIVSDELRVAHSDVTEMAKYMRNTMLAARIALCNEYEAFCRAKNIDYESVRQLATADPRVGASHTQVPGPDGKRGFGGTCLPKDLKALCQEMTAAGVHCGVLAACDDRNERFDRTQRDWLVPGRSVSAVKK